MDGQTAPPSLIRLRGLRLLVPHLECLSLGNQLAQRLMPFSVAGGLVGVRQGACGDGITRGRGMAPQGAFVTRCYIELGYQPDTAVLVSAALQSFLTERQIGVTSISSLISWLRGESPNQGDDLEDDDDELFDPTDEGGFGPILLDGLDAAASKGNALAHYALALIYAPGDDDDLDAGSSYWYSQGQQGRVLTGVEKEWAEAHETRLAQAEKYTRHLREAGRLGNQHALLDLAERFDDPSFFEQPRHDVDADPAAVAAIAERMGCTADARHWLTAAAESGDTDAMLQLIEDYDQGDLLRCWTWAYLYSVGRNGSDPGRALRDQRGRFGVRR